jgi:branched-chain amino acid transport system ATP-binding protein
MLEITDLVVAYGEVRVLRSVSLEVREGEIVTLIGSNGAGKTTTLRAVSGLVQPLRGTIRFKGKTITGLSAAQIVSLGLVQVPEGRRIFPLLSVEDNLKVGAHLIRDGRQIAQDLDRVYAIFPRLAERRRQLAGTMSGGEQQMAALGRAIMARPRLLLLDEPSLGIAPQVIEMIAEAILSFRKSGMTILLVEQNAQIALALADRGYVIETGRIVLTDIAANLRTSPLVAESYLGLGRETPKRLVQTEA